MGVTSVRISKTSADLKKNQKFVLAVSASGDVLPLTNFHGMRKLKNIYVPKNGSYMCIRQFVLMRCCCSVLKSFISSTQFYIIFNKISVGEHFFDMLFSNDLKSVPQLTTNKK